MTTRQKLFASSFKAMGAGFALALLLPNSLAVAQTSAKPENKCTLSNGQVVYLARACPAPGTVGEDMARKEYEFTKRKQAEAESNRMQANAPAVENLTRPEAVDRMTTYAVVIGRAVACGAPNTQDAFSRVGKWMDAQNLTKQYLAVFAAGVKQAAEQQRDGSTPDACSKVKSVFASFPWP
jgi:hypothetical protein